MQAVDTVNLVGKDIPSTNPSISKGFFMISNVVHNLRKISSELRVSRLYTRLLASFFLTSEPLDYGV